MGSRPSPRAQQGFLNSPCCCCISQHSIRRLFFLEAFRGKKVISSFLVCLYHPLLPLPSSMFSSVSKMTKIQAFQNLTA